MTVWHLFAVYHNTLTGDGRFESWGESLSSLITSFVCTTKEFFETFVSRGLHVRLGSLLIVES